MSYQNFVQCRVVTPVSASATDLGVFDAVAPYVLPPLDGGVLVLTDSPTKPSKVEVIRYAYRTALGLYGLQRGQEGTTAQEWTGPVYAYQSLTAGDFQSLLGAKVDKEVGKGLSTNDLTAELLARLNAAAPLDSPAFTGNPTAPTPAAADNDTSIATTAFVRAAMALFGLGASVVNGTQAEDAARDVSGFFSAYNLNPEPSTYPEEVMLVALQHPNPDYAARLAVGTSGTPYVRSKVAGTWLPAKELFHTGNQLSLGTTPAAARTALELVKGTSPGNVLEAGAELVGSHTVECFAFSDSESAPGATIYTNIPATEGAIPHLIIRGALNGYTEPFEARLSWYFYQGAVHLPSVLITATGGVSGVRFYLRPENGKIVIRIDFGSSFYLNRLAFDALQIPGAYNPDPTALRGWSAVASNATGSGEVEARRVRTYHTGNWYLGTDKQHTANATGTVTLNLAAASIFDLTLTGNVTLTASNTFLPAGETRAIVVRIRQGATPFTLTWWGGITWLAASTPAAPGANKVAEYVFSYSGAGWIGRPGAKN